MTQHKDDLSIYLLVGFTAIVNSHRRRKRPPPQQTTFLERSLEGEWKTAMWTIAVISFETTLRLSILQWCYTWLCTLLLVPGLPSISLISPMVTCFLIGLLSCYAFSCSSLQCSSPLSFVRSVVTCWSSVVRLSGYLMSHWSPPRLGILPLIFSSFVCSLIGPSRVQIPFNLSVLCTHSLPLVTYHLTVLSSVPSLLI